MIIWVVILAILVILFLTLLLIQTVSLLAEQNTRISSLEKTLSALRQKPTFYQKNYYHQGDIMSQGEINVTPQGDAIGVVVGSYNNLEGVLTKTSGDIANISNDPPQSASQNVKPMRKPLSSELEKPIEKDSENSTDSENNNLDEGHSLKMINPGSNLEMVPSKSDESLSDEP